MKFKLTTIQGRKVREWECCGNLWQIILSKKFPERYKWRPTCPNCKRKGDLDGKKN